MTRQNWSHHYHEYMHSKQWRKKRRKAIRHHGPKCNRCGVNRKTTGQRVKLEVHHKHYRRFGNEHLDDLEILCETCHKAEHRQRDAFPHKRSREDIDAEFKAIIGS